MSLHPHAILPVPEDTVRIARAAFPKGTPYMTLRDQLGTIFQDDAFLTLLPNNGQPALPPWRLALGLGLKRLLIGYDERAQTIHHLCEHVGGDETIAQ